MSSKSEKARERAERAAQAFAEAKKKQRRRNILSGLGVLLAIVLIVGGGIAISKWRQDNSNQAVEGKIPAFGTSDYGLVVGDTSAPHTIVAYEDFICPICGTLEASAGDGLSQAIADGKVKIDYRPIAFLSTYSDDALNAFFVVRDAAGDDVAKKFHDILFANQPSESASSFPGSDWLIEKAVEAGATEAEVKDGIENDAQADAVKAATEESTDAGVTGTPTVLLDGKIFNDGSDWSEIGKNLVAAVQ